ncbi:minor tail protein [Gordonia phage Morrissey]|nr:minor tail protein [Gordonia phage Morrissey]
MPLSNTALQTLYTALKGMGAYVSAHTDDPGTTGANEVSGGVYARVQATLPTGSNGAGTAPQVSIPIPAGTTVKYLGVWSALTGGTFIGTHNSQLSPNLPFPVDGTLTAQIGEVITSTP